MDINCAVGLRVLDPAQVINCVRSMQASIRDGDGDRVIFEDGVETEHGRISSNILGFSIPTGKSLRVRIALEASLGRARANSVREGTWSCA